MEPTQATCSTSWRIPAAGDDGETDCIACRSDANLHIGGDGHDDSVLHGWFQCTTISLCHRKHGGKSPHSSNRLSAHRMWHLSDARTVDCTPDHKICQPIVFQMIVFPGNMNKPSLYYPTLTSIRQRQQEIRTEIDHIQKHMAAHVANLMTPSSTDTFSPTWMNRLLIRTTLAVRVIKGIMAVWRAFRK